MRLPAVGEPAPGALAPQATSRGGIVKSVSEKVRARLEAGCAFVGGLRRGDHVVYELRVVAQLLQARDRREDHGGFASRDRLGSLLGEEVAVNHLLQRRELAADDLDDFRREVLGEDGVGAPQDEFVDELGELPVSLLRERQLLVRGVRLAPVEDRLFKLFVKLAARAQQTGVAKVNHGVKLVEVVLHRGAAQHDPPQARHGPERLVRQRVTVLQPVRLVADDQVL